MSTVETERNEHRRGIAWQFTSRDARIKLEKLYPVKPPHRIDYEPFANGSGSL